MLKFKVHVPASFSAPETGVINIPYLNKPWYGGFIEFDKDGCPIPARYSFYPENYFKSQEQAIARSYDLRKNL